MDHQRISDEIESLKAALVRDEKEISTIQTTHDEDQEKVRSFKEEQSDLQQMHDLARRLRDEIGKLPLFSHRDLFLILTFHPNSNFTSKGKITNKRSQIATRREELKLIAPRASGKDLHSTEKEANMKMEEKDTLSNQISLLNKDTFILNNQINQANISATRAEKLVREKEQQFAQEQQNITKRQELNKNIASYKEQEEKVSETR